MDVHAVHQLQQSANNSNNKVGVQAHHGAQSKQTIVFSQNVGFSRSSVRSNQHAEAQSQNSSKNHNAGVRISKSALQHYKLQANAGAYHCQIQNNQGQTFAEQTQLNQQAGCNVNQQVIQYNINVGNLPDTQTHVNQLVALHQQQQQQVGHHTTTPLQLQQSGACNPKMSTQNAQQYVGGVRRTLADVQQGSLSTQQYFRSNSADQSFPKSKQQQMKPNSSAKTQADKYSNYPSKTPAPFVNVIKGKAPAKQKVQRQRSSPPNQQPYTFYHPSAVATQYQQTPHQHAAIPTQNRPLPPAYSTIATSFEQQPQMYSTIPASGQQLPCHVPLQSPGQQRFIELQHQQTKPRSSIPQQSQQTERVSPQQNQQCSPPIQQESPHIQQVTPHVPNQRPQSFPQLQQPSLGEQRTRPVSSDSKVRSATTGRDFPCDLTLDNLIKEVALDNLIKEVESLNKARMNLEERSQHQKTTSKRLSPFNQRKSPNNEICDDIQIVNCFSLQGKVDSNRGTRLTSHEAITMKARNIEQGQLQAPALETGDSADAKFLRTCSTTSDDRLLPRIVARFLGKDVSDVRSRDYVMYALSDDPRVAEAAIAAHLQERTKMFVCVEFPPMSPWSGMREAKKSYFLVKSARDVLCIVNFYPCTSVRMVLVVCRMSQHAERRVQQTRSFPEVNLTTNASNDRHSPILSGLLQHSPISNPPAEQVENVSAVSGANTPPTRPFSTNQQTKSPARENTAEQASQGSKLMDLGAKTPPTRPGPVNQQQSSPTPHEIKGQGSNVNVSSAEHPPIRLSPTKQQLTSSVQERTTEQREDQAPFSSPVKQTRSQSCSIESEEEKMTRIRKEVEALLNAGKPDLRKAAAKRSRGDPELPTLDRIRRKRKSRGIDVDSRSTVSDITMRDETPPTAKLQECVKKRVLSASANPKGQSSSPKINDDVTSKRDDVTIKNVVIKVEPDNLDYNLQRDTNVNQVDVKSGRGDVKSDHDDVEADHDDVRHDHDDLTARRDDETVASTKRLNPEKTSLNCEKAAKRSEDAENGNLRKRKRASMRAGSCRAPRLDLVYRSYLDSLQPSPIVPRQCVPRDVTITPCSIRISDVFSLNNVA